MAIYRTTEDDATVVNFGSEIRLDDERAKGDGEGHTLLVVGEKGASSLFSCFVV